MNIEHPLGIPCPVSLPHATLRHPTEVASLASKAGGTLYDVFYQATYKIPPKRFGLDFDNEPDFRIPLTNHHLPLIDTLKLCTKQGGKTYKVNIPVSSLSSSNLPLELCGEDPSAYNSNPSLWLLNQNNDDRFWGYTEWKLLGMYRKVATQHGPRKNPSCWLIQLYRQGNMALLAQDETDIFTLKELTENMKSPLPSISARAEKILGSASYLFGHTYFGGHPTIPPKDQPLWEAHDAFSPLAQTFLSNHTVSDNVGRLFPKTQNATPNAQAGFLPLSSSRNGTRDKLWIFEEKLGQDSLHTQKNLNILVNAVFSGQDFNTMLQALSSPLSPTTP